MYFECDVENKLLGIFPENGGVIAEISATGPDGGKVVLPILKRSAQKIVADAAELVPWSPDAPRLYRLAVGEKECRFGFMSLRTCGNDRVLLNGERIFLRGCIRGITAHEHPNLTGGTLREAAEKYIRQAKKYGFNLVRFHSTVPHPEFVEAADELGFLIHAEIGFAYSYDEHGKKTGIDMDSRDWEETIVRYRNHPSMAIFCIGNEMHNSGHQPGVKVLCERGRQLAPGKLILDNSGWGEYDRTTADIFCQHIAYYFPFKRHAGMFESDACWRINGSAYDAPLTAETSGSLVRTSVRREATPVRPVLAHEAMHYIEIADYAALNRKFDEFAARVGPEYLKANGIVKPRFLTELPELIRRKKLTARMPDLIRASEEFKKAAIKVYMEKLRFSRLCGFEMLQFADCLKYENRNGIVDCFDDDKYIDAAWMREFNADTVLLMDVPKENFRYGEPVNAAVYLSCFTPDAGARGTLTVAVDCGGGTREIVYEGRDFVPVPGVHKLAELCMNFTAAPEAKTFRVTAEFVSDKLKIANHWKLWLYPEARLDFRPETDLREGGSFAALLNAAAAGRETRRDISVTDALDDRLFDQLAEGKTVLLLYDRNASGHQYLWPSTLERFKPCIWDRGSNLGGVFNDPVLAAAMGGGRYFDLNAQPLLEGGWKLNLDDFPCPVDELVFGADKPVRDRMKGMIDGVKCFIDADTLRNFCHTAAIKVGPGKLIVCTMNRHNCMDAGAAAFFTGLLNRLPALAVRSEISAAELKRYLAQATARGPVPEDVMNHFWELDDKPVEDTLFWEACNVDLRKIK